MDHLLAQLTNPVLPPSIGQGGTVKGGTAVGMFISNLVGLLFIMAFLLALFFLLIGALSWITSGGDKNNLENARNRIIHALTGLIVVAATWAIMALVGQFFGFNFAKNSINFPLPSFDQSQAPARILRGVQEY